MMFRHLLIATLAAAAPAVAAQQQQSDTARAHDAFTRGRAAVNARRIDEAVKSLERAVELNPTRYEYHMWLGHALSRQIASVNFMKKGFVAKRAGGEYNRAVELAPTNVDAAEARLEFFINAPGMVGGGMDKAETEAARIASLSPMRGNFARAKIALAKKDTASVEREYRAAFAQYPDSSRTQNVLATFLADQKRFDDAFALVDQRLSHAPDDTTAIYHVGRIAALSGKQLARGESALERYLALIGDDRPLDKASAHYRLGMIREQLADTAGARVEYRRALDLYPGYAAVAAALKKIGR